MDINVAENELPEAVYKAVAAAIAKHDDANDATAQAVKAIRKLPEFDSLVDVLVNRAIRRLVSDARHQRTVQIKRESGQYGKAGKIDYQRSRRVNRVFATMYELSVAGTTLGALLGENIAAAADAERGIGNGHLMNAALLDKVAPLVPAGKRVRDCVTDKRLRSIWRGLNEKARDAAA